VIPIDKSNNYKFSFVRRKLSCTRRAVEAAVAITVNKSQGRTLDKVVLSLFVTHSLSLTLFLFLFLFLPLTVPCCP